MDFYAQTRKFMKKMQNCVEKISSPTFLTNPYNKLLFLTKPLRKREIKQNYRSTKTGFHQVTILFPRYKCNKKHPQPRKLQFVINIFSVTRKIKKFPYFSYVIFENRLHKTNFSYKTLYNLVIKMNAL